MPTVFASAIPDRENLRHFAYRFRNLSELEESESVSDAVEFVPPFTTPFVRQITRRLGEPTR
jgi:hypothetical protein